MTNNTNLQVGYFFPTAIGVCVDLLPTEQLLKLQLNCSELFASVPDSNNANWLSGNQSPYNTMSTHNIIDDVQFDNLSLAVSAKVKEFALTHADNGAYYCDHAWLNVYQQGQYQEPHTHSSPYIYSAVYFVDACEFAGLFVAQSPFVHTQIEQNHVGPNPLTDTKRWWKPQSNMLIIFKSSLSHYTTPNNGKRVSVAFNYKPF